MVLPRQFDGPKWIPESYRSKKGRRRGRHNRDSDRVNAAGEVTSEDAFESSIRIVGMIRWPGMLKQRQVADECFAELDW